MPSSCTSFHFHDLVIQWLFAIFQAWAIHYRYQSLKVTPGIARHFDRRTSNWGAAEMSGCEPRSCSVVGTSHGQRAPFVQHFFILASLVFTLSEPDLINIFISIFI